MTAVTFALAIAIAEEGGTRVQSDAWVDAQIAEARRLYEPLGIEFRWTVESPLAARFVHLETRTDRDLVGQAHYETGAINVSVVTSLRDVDEPERQRMGVCWRSRVDATRRYIVLARHALPTTLAHELGHFFGNGHSLVADNVMSYTRTGATVFFSADQSAIVVRIARSYVATGELVPLFPARIVP